MKIARSHISAQTLLLSARDGYPLSATLHRAAASAHNVVMINAGTGIRRNYYHKFANFLAEHNYHVLTYDYRGIGASRPRSLRGFSATMSTWAQQDMAGVAAWCAHEFATDKLFVIGHSAGGQLVGLAGINHLVRGLVLVAAQSGYWGYWPPHARYRYAVMWRAMPLIAKAWGYLPGTLGIGEDLPRGVACEWAQWCRHPRYLFAFAEAKNVSHYKNFRAPILAYSFWDDDYAPLPAVEALLREYGTTALAHRHFDASNSPTPRIGHFGFFREQYRATLWQEVLAWLEAQTR